MCIISMNSSVFLCPSGFSPLWCSSSEAGRRLFWNSLSRSGLVKRVRYILLTLGLLFHLWLEYSLNIPLFQWTFFQPTFCLLTQMIETCRKLDGSGMDAIS